MQLYHGDCLEIMKEIPDKSVDLVLTDPPFGINFQSNHRKEKYNHIENDNKLDWLPEWCKEIKRVVKDNAHFIFFVVGIMLMCLSKKLKNILRLKIF